MRAAALLILLLVGMGAAWLWLKPEAKRNTCAGVTPLNLPNVSPHAAPSIWQEAVAAPGHMFDVDGADIRYRYFSPQSREATQVYFNETTQDWSAETGRALCHHFDASEGQNCRFFEDDKRYALLDFKTDHLIEAAMDYIESKIVMVQADGAHLEIFVTSKGTHAIDVAECDTAQALWMLSGNEN